jgi:hypothetical protein
LCDCHTRIKDKDIDGWVMTSWQKDSLSPGNYVNQVDHVDQGECPLHSYWDKLRKVCCSAKCSLKLSDLKWCLKWRDCFFIKFSNITFLQNMFISLRVVLCVRTDRRIELFK